MIGAAAVAAYFFAKKATTTPQNEGVAALSSPTGRASMENIASVYGDKFAGDVAAAAVTSKNAGEMVEKLASSKNTAFGDVSTSTQGALFAQTSLKSGGGSKGLSAGTYKLGSTTVTVKNVAAKDSIAKQKGYI